MSPPTTDDTSTCMRSERPFVCSTCERSFAWLRNYSESRCHSCDTMVEYVSGKILEILPALVTAAPTSQAPGQPAPGPERRSEPGPSGGASGVGKRSAPRVPKCWGCTSGAQPTGKHRLCDGCWNTFGREAHRDGFLTLNDVPVSPSSSGDESDDDRHISRADAQFFYDYASAAGDDCQFHYRDEFSDSD